MVSMKTFIIVSLCIASFAFIVNLLVLALMDFPHKLVWSRGEYAAKIFLNVLWIAWAAYLLVK